MKKKLAFGLMRLPLLNAADPTSIDIEMVKQMVDLFMEAGFTYFDTAAPYHNMASETAFRECVSKRYPRSAYTITGKLSIFTMQSASEIQPFFDAQLERCGVEYFDYYWLHALDKDLFRKAEELGAFEFLLQKKAEGTVKHIGFSFHDTADVLDDILTHHPEMEYVQLQINYIDWESDNVQSRKCYEVCVKHSKPVMVMEPVKGGRLANLPDEAKALMQETTPGMSDASWAIRFVASLDNVTYVLSGMNTVEHVADNVSYMNDFHPLSQVEQNVVKKATEIILSKAYISCTGCRYCVEGCPQKIAIPDYFALVNEFSRYGPAMLDRIQERYIQFTEKQGMGRASDCVGCGQCEGHCPQHLPVTQYLKDVVKVLES